MGRRRDISILPRLRSWCRKRLSKSGTESQPKSKHVRKESENLKISGSTDEGADWHEMLVESVSTSSGVRFRYRVIEEIGRGTFGTVYKIETDQPAEDERLLAMKVLKCRKRGKVREIGMMKMMRHVNLVRLRYYCTVGVCQLGSRQKLIMDWMPESLHSVISRHRRDRTLIQPVLYRCFLYQIFRGLAFMHHRAIAHRDLKPMNILVDVSKGTLKLCDFGSAKVLTDGVSNTSYICSRWYRAPELLFGSRDYTCAIDMWSAGCCFAEMVRLTPLFRGDSTVDQISRILAVLGSPTRQEAALLGIRNDDALPRCSSRDMDSVLERRASQPSVSLLRHLLRYAPCDRPKAWDALADPFFDELRQPGCCLPNAVPLPDLFSFTDEELEYNPSINSQLRPLGAPAAKESVSNNESRTS